MVAATRRHFCGHPPTISVTISAGPATFPEPAPSRLPPTQPLPTPAPSVALPIEPFLARRLPLAPPPVKPTRTPATAETTAFSKQSPCHSVAPSMLPMTGMTADSDTLGGATSKTYTSARTNPLRPQRTGSKQPHSQLHTSLTAFRPRTASVGAPFRHNIELERTMLLERTMHPPRPMSALLTGATPASSARPLQHPAALVPVVPSPRPSSSRATGARNFQIQMLERMLQPPRQPPAGGQSRTASDVPSTSTALSPNRQAVETQEAAWADFRCHIYRRLATPNDAPPPPDPPRRKLRPPRRRKKKPMQQEEGQLQPEENESYLFRITTKLQQMARKNHVRMMDVFRKYDSDSSGAIDQFEFEAAILELGLNDVPSYEAKKVFEAYDRDGSGSLDFDELSKMIKEGRGPSKLAPELQAGAVTGYMPTKFRSHRGESVKLEESLKRLKEIDADGDGVADMKEILAFLLAEGYDCSTARELMKELDADGDGEVTEAEWKVGMRKLSDMLYEQIEGVAQASALRALTEPVAPPSTELFIDLLFPKLLTSQGTELRTHLDQRPSEAPKGSTIADQTQRGIQMQQLRCILPHTKRRCGVEGWVTIDNVLNRELGLPEGAASPLESHAANMYDVISYVIKPATRSRRCSFVELVASDPQPPTWFVAHMYSEPLIDLVACLEQHTRDRGPDINSTTYWLSAFAISPWSLDEQLVSDPFQTPFYKVMEKTVGMVTVVDRDRSKGGPGSDRCACAYSRVWICFEAAVGLQMSAERGYIYDIYTANRHVVEGDNVHPPFGIDEPPTFIIKEGGETTQLRQAVGLTDPAFPLELRLRGDMKRYENDDAAAHRQRAFPSSIVVNALSSKLQTARATVSADRTHILNAVVAIYDQTQAKNDAAIKDGAVHLQRTLSLCEAHRLRMTKERLAAEPPDEHYAYTIFNALLQARIAPVALERALADGQCSWGKETLERVTKDISTAALTNLCVSLRGSKDSAQFEEAIGCLPESLEELDLELPDVLYQVKHKARDNADASTWRAIKIFPELIKIALRQQAVPPSERDAATKFSRLIQPPEMVIGRLVGYAHEDALFRAEKLEHVDLTGWPELKQVPWQLFEMPNLRILNLSNCSNLDTVAVQFPLIPSQLTTLIFDGCTALTALEEGIAIKFSNLTELGLANCTALSKLPMWVRDLERKGAGVIKPTHLS